MNNELRENEINRDYYLKRAIIYLNLLCSSPFVAFGLGISGEFFTKEILKDGDWGGGLGFFIGLLIFFIFVGLSTYHSTKS